MAEDFLELRNRVHKNEIRFDARYRAEKGDFANGTVISVRKNGELEGYAIYNISKGRRQPLKGLIITEICANHAKSLIGLLDKIIELGKEMKVDFILLRRFDEPHDKLFSSKGFIDMSMNVLPTALINLEELLRPLSGPRKKGKSIKLQIIGQAPLYVIVGKEGFSISSEIDNPDLIISTDSTVFLRLFFNKTSIIREIINKRPFLSNKRHIFTALKFFNMIKQKRWYFPDADGA